MAVTSPPNPVNAGFLYRDRAKFQFFNAEFRAIEAKYPVPIGQADKNYGMQIAMYRTGVREVSHTPAGCWL